MHATPKIPLWSATMTPRAKFPTSIEQRVQKNKDVRTLEPFSSSRLEELHQLVRHCGIHPRCIKVIEILGAANGLSLGQHLLDKRRELDRPDGIVVEDLTGIQV